MESDEKGLWPAQMFRRCRWLSLAESGLCWDSCGLFADCWPPIGPTRSRPDCPSARPSTVTSIQLGITWERFTRARTLRRFSLAAETAL